ncbi:auxin efflux carrier [Phycomyces nitens]|nr:auxin efflux carrier [Phycomyces nitens]
MLHLIISAVQAVLQVMVMVIFGYGLTKLEYFTPEKQKWLSTLNLVFFTPCLMFNNIASIISFDKLLTLWPIPVFYVIFTVLTYVISRLVMRFTRLDPYYRPFVLACSMFANTNSLPVAIISSLAVSEAGKVLFWYADDTQETVSARGISYILFFAMFCNFVRWSYGYSLLQKHDNIDNTKTDHRDSVSQYGATSSSSLSSLSSVDDLEYNEQGDKRRRRSSHTITFDNQKDFYDETQSLLSFPNIDLDNRAANHHWTRRWLTKIVSLALSFHSFMSPPLYAAFFGLLIGLVPSFKSMMYDQSGFLYPCLTKAIESCGRAAVPLTMVCLGSQLTSIADSQRPTESYFKKPISLAILIRMFIIPLLVIPMVILFALYGGILADVAKDPCFLCVMILVSCSPTAVNLSQITQVSGMYEEEMLRLLFWSYGVFCVPVCTFVVFISLLIVDHLL